MLRLAVTTRAETFERMRDPLAARGVEVEHLQTSGRTFALSDPVEASVDVGFVYPSRLMEGAVVSAALDVPWVNDRDAVLASRNKAGVITRLDAAGVPVPETVMVSNPVEDDALAAVADAFSFPAVVKPNSATRGVGVARVSDPDSLHGVTDYLDLVHDFGATGDKAYLVQEYLPDARDYRAMVLDGVCVGAVERRLPAAARESGRWTHNVHRGAEAEAVDLPDEHRELAERTADVLDIPYLGVDLLEADGRVVVTETNARPTIDDASKYDPDFYDRLAALVEDTARRRE